MHKTGTQSATWRAAELLKRYNTSRPSRDGDLTMYFKSLPMGLAVGSSVVDPAESTFVEDQMCDMRPGC
jgi:hypothetical protein